MEEMISASKASGKSRPREKDCFRPCDGLGSRLTEESMTTHPKLRSAQRRRDGEKKNPPPSKRHEARAPRGEFAQRSSGLQRTEAIPRGWRTAVGTHAVSEALKSSRDFIQEAWLEQGWERSQELRELEKGLKEARVKIQIKPAGTLEKIAPHHQGAMVHLEGRPRVEWSELAEKDPSVLLLLDGLEDPHNLGAILRTSWLTGVHGVFLPEDRAVGLTPTVHKVACGGVEHVPVEREVNFSQSVQRLKEQGYWIFGLSHKAKGDLFQMKLPRKIVWAVGAEDKGLRVTTERLCDELVSIPQLSDAASYNASVATAMALTETLRQHRSL